MHHTTGHDAAALEPTGPGDLVAQLNRVPITNIDVPTLACGQDALLFLPDRVLVRSGRRWTDVAYGELQVAASVTSFIESGAVPRDGRRIGSTWQYVNAKGGPDRRFKSNRQLPIMQYGELELRSPGGLWWIVDCSRADAAEWTATALRHPPMLRAPAPARTAPVQPRPPQTPFAAPGRQGRLFAYADLLANAPLLRPHAGPFAIVDVETTGLAPEAGDRIVEIAIARVDRDGRVEDEFVTLVNPDGRDTGPVFVHGIENAAVRDAPRFADIAGEVVRQLDGCVFVAHNAAFEERFLAAEFARAGLRIGPVPALCTLWLARRTLNTPNHKLATLARHAGIAMPDAHAALGDVRAVAALLPALIARAGGELGYAGPPLAVATLRLPPPVAFQPRTRAVGLRRGTDGWMASILARLPMSAAEAGGADAERYLDYLAIALADGRIVGDEAHALARLAGAAGFGSAQVAALNERFLESLREAAFADGVLTAGELRQLRAAAAALGVPDYFDDLRVDPAPAANAAGRRRCGHCRVPGHYRNRCPELVQVAE
ncbi:3'-5' exonuclease [Dactylosporangium sp. McL0621]|uniref:3'-5' exonuclease n=1 Tax=Dactylosporangium sp. McL0621 TaxID=3415678 RepID=UPI003CEA4ED6